MSTSIGPIKAIGQALNSFCKLLGTFDRAINTIDLVVATGEAHAKHWHDTSIADLESDLKSSTEEPKAEPTALK